MGPLPLWCRSRLGPVLLGGIFCCGAGKKPALFGAPGGARPPPGTRATFGGVRAVLAAGAPSSCFVPSCLGKATFGDFSMGWLGGGCSWGPPPRPPSFWGRSVLPKCASSGWGPCVALSTHPGDEDEEEEEEEKLRRAAKRGRGLLRMAGWGGGGIFFLFFFLAYLGQKGRGGGSWGCQRAAASPGLVGVTKLRRQRRKSTELSWAEPRCVPA